MAAIAPIAIVDGQTVPVTHTFNPIQSIDPATYSRNGDTSVPVIGQERILLSLKMGASTSDAVNRANLTLRIPVLETPEGGSSSGYVAPPKVAFYLQATVNFFLPNRCTAAHRKDLRVLLKNLLSDAQVVELIDTMARPY